MVEQTYALDSVFGCLSDPTRRDILSRVGKRGMSISAIAQQYNFSFAGVAKHLDVLQRAGLVRKTRQGKEQIITIEPRGLAAANDFLETYRQLWEQRLDSLDGYLTAINSKG